LAFRNGMLLQDERVSALTVFETWMKKDKAAAKAVAAQIFDRVKFNGSAGAWKRLARADPEFGLRLCLMATDEAEKEVSFWQFLQWHSYMLSRGYPMEIPRTERNFQITDGSATQPISKGGDATYLIQEGMAALAKLPMLDTATVCSTLLWVEAEQRMRTPQNAQTLLEAALRHLPDAQLERAKLIQWVQQEPLLSEETRTMVLQHPALVP
jgi:hypothetical protein